MAGPSSIQSSFSSKGNKARKLKFTTVVAIAIAIPLSAAVFAVLASMNLHHYNQSSNENKAEDGSVLTNRDGDFSSKEEYSSIGRNVKYHVIFSTGCSIFQDWQSYIFFYYALKSKQPGIITRIVSGCDDTQREELQKVFDEQIASLVDDGRFRIHFTPDYSKLKRGENYKYWNKPFGVHHWLENELGFPDKASKEDRDAIVVLMDPDQIIMRPFQNNDFSNTNWQFIDKKETPRTMIDHGKPMGQQYGFGLQWKNSIDMTNYTLFGLTEPSPVTSMDYHKAHKGYIVGPPYIATGNDFYKITGKWTQFAIPVHDQYPHLLAEMYAYCLAAAHLGLSHQTAGSFMVSDIHTGKDEGWPYIDGYTRSNVCKRHTDYNPERLPNVLHFCQRYGLGDYFFGKYRLPKNFLTCESPLLLEPPLDFATTATVTRFPDGTTKTYDEKGAIRNAFMLCYMIFAMNEAAEHWKQRHCPAGTANLERTIDYKHYKKLAAEDAAA